MNYYHCQNLALRPLGTPGEGPLGEGVNNKVGYVWECYVIAGWVFRTILIGYLGLNVRCGFYYQVYHWNSGLVIKTFDTKLIPVLACYPTRPSLYPKVIYITLG